MTCAGKSLFDPIYSISPTEQTLELLRTSVGRSVYVYEEEIVKGPIQRYLSNIHDVDSDTVQMHALGVLAQVAMACFQHGTHCVCRWPCSIKDSISF